MTLSPLPNRLLSRVLSRVGAMIAIVAFAMHTAAAPRAAYVEITDRWTSATGLRVSLDDAGFEPVAVDLTQPLPACDVLLLGSFVTEDATYRAWVQQHAAAIRQFITAGGVVIEFTQADQTAQAPAFLTPTLSVQRTDLDAGPVRLLDADHPLVVALPRLADDNDPSLDLPAHFSRTGSWETWTNQSGFNVIGGVGASPERDPALLEGQIGTGRVILTSLYFDKLFNAQGTLIATDQYRAVSRAFFLGLRRYVELVMRGEAPAVEPTPGYVEPQPLPYVPGSTTFVALPDTQIYAESIPATFNAQTQWIVDNAQARQIAFVLHEGDITNRNTREQWQNAQNAMRLLDGVVPYAMAPGNHDYGPGGNAADRSTFFNEYFPVSNYASLPTFGGTLEPGKLDSSYHLFDAAGKQWIVIALEWGPRDLVLPWIDGLLTEHNDRIAIIVTHAYTFSDDSRYAWRLGKRQSWNPYYYGTANDPAGTNDGEDIWEDSLRRHGNVAMVLSGHVLNDGTGYVRSTGDRGNTVHQMLANYQFRAAGGEGYLRLLELLPDGRTIQVKTYSPTLDRYLTSPDQQFVIDLNVVLGGG